MQWETWLRRATRLRGDWGGKNQRAIAIHRMDIKLGYLPESGEVALKDANTLDKSQFPLRASVPP